MIMIPIYIIVLKTRLILTIVISGYTECETRVNKLQKMMPNLTKLLTWAGLQTDVYNKILV